MTVQIRGFSFASSGTLPVPPGTVAGDVLVAKLRSFWQQSVPSPLVAPAGWTQTSNQTGGYQASGSYAGSTFGFGVWWRVATASEPASYTFSAPLAEALMGGMWAVYSSLGQTMNVLQSGINTSASDPAYVTNLFHSAGANDLMLHSFSGHGTAFTSYSGFVNARTDHGGGTLHSTTPFSDYPFPAPDNIAQLYDIVLGFQSEPGPFSTGTRTAVPNLADEGTLAYANTYVRITETGVAPPAAGGWTTWIVD